jgi:periplasmic protein TonB
VNTHTKILLLSFCASLLLHLLIFLQKIDLSEDNNVGLTSERITLTLRSALQNKETPLKPKRMSPKPQEVKKSQEFLDEPQSQAIINSEATKTVGSIQNLYLNNLRQLIEKNQSYPLVSKKLKEQGDVEVQFHILADGLIQNIQILKSSGHLRLDQAAKETIEKIQKYEPIPVELNVLKLTIIQNIKFELKTI